MSEKRVIDWEGIEREYRAGVRSVREIAAEFEVSHTLINRRSREEGWERDLTAKIRAKADALVSKEAVSSLVSTDTKVPEKAIVEANAAIQAQIRREHRTDIQKTKRIANKLLDRLEAVKPSEANLKEHASVLKQLADTQRVVVNLEREAFGIAQVVDTPENEEKRIPSDHLEDARRVAFILSRAAVLATSKG